MGVAYTRLTWAVHTNVVWMLKNNKLIEKFCIFNSSNKLR